MRQPQIRILQQCFGLVYPEAGQIIGQILPCNLLELPRDILPADKKTFSNMLQGHILGIVLLEILPDFPNKPAIRRLGIPLGQVLEQGLELAPPILHRKKPFAVIAKLQ
ncbi:hypothetical protein D3C74_375020 [compost metagenome]